MRHQCEHPGDNVVVDILSGDLFGGPGGDQGVQWCRSCGAYRRVFDVYGTKPRYADWDIPSKRSMWRGWLRRLRDQFHRTPSRRRSDHSAARGM